MDAYEYEKSKSYFNQALNIYKKMFGESSSNAVSTLANLVLIEYERSEYKNAIVLYQNVIELGCTTKFPFFNIFIIESLRKVKISPPCLRPLGRYTNLNSITQTYFQCV